MIAASSSRAVSALQMTNKPAQGKFPSRPSLWLLIEFDRNSRRKSRQIP
jgi:hypothetical protein